MSDFQKLRAQIEDLAASTKDPALSEEAKKEKEEKLREKMQEAQTRQREIVEFRNTFTKLLQDQRQRIYERTMIEIKAAVEGFAKGKYNVVFNKAGLVFSDGITDITDNIITSLNKDKPAGE